MYDYFFSGGEYIRVIRNGDLDFGKLDSGSQPDLIHVGWHWPDGFGRDGIDAALYSGAFCYFFKGVSYIRVQRGLTGPGDTANIVGPNPISDWGWEPSNFGTGGINGALWSGSVVYFFSGPRYIRVSRTSDTDFGTVDPGYPKSISGNWALPLEFNNGIDAVFPSGRKCYFFKGTGYAEVSRGFEGSGFTGELLVPLPITDWPFPSGFGTNGIDAVLYSGGPLEPASSGGLSSNLNYWIGDEGNNLMGVTIVVSIDTDLGSLKNGWSIQLNCSTSQAPGSDLPAWQQFFIYGTPFEEFVGDAPVDVSCPIHAGLELWNVPENGPLNSYCLPEDVQIVYLEGTEICAAGSKLAIELIYAPDGSGSITGANYSYQSPGDIYVTTATINIPSGYAIGPIEVISVNIVAEYDGEIATISSGEGTITYMSENPLTASGNFPTYSEVWFTAETANIVYEQLPAAGVDISQLWGVAPPGWVPPNINDLSKDRIVKRSKLSEPRHPKRGVARKVELSKCKWARKVGEIPQGSVDDV